MENRNNCSKEISENIFNFIIFSLSFLFLQVKSYGESCVKSNECNMTTGLYCPRDSFTSPCNCPKISNSIFCDCQVRFHWNYSTNQCENCDSREYYDNYDFDPKLAKCTEKLRENVMCKDTYQCYEPMRCNNTSNQNKTCQCADKEYHNFSNLTCLPQGTINQTCSIDLHCRSDQYLICNSTSTQCTCISQFPLWSNSSSSEFHFHKLRNKELFKSKNLRMYNIGNL